MKEAQVDIYEYDILTAAPELLETLLKDHTTMDNIFWATDNYAERGVGYQFSDPITIESITGENSSVIVPRALKSRQEQQKRSREMAEVFTPSWICNKQNNLVDNAWFGRAGVFNTEVDDPDGTHSWNVNPHPVVFPTGTTWLDYDSKNRLEITCGEAPYLVNRYDRVTGIHIPVGNRIGILDRKLRIVSENTHTSVEWLEWALSAYQGTYGYEWQGDNIFLARKALLYTFIDYYRTQFGKNPPVESLLEIAEIISWNIWQMDGLKGVIPNSCVKLSKTRNTSSLFSPEDLGEPQEVTLFDCPGCKNKDIHSHTGKYALIKDWKEDKVVPFVSLIRKE